MASSPEATDSSFPKPVVPETRKETPPDAAPLPEKEKQKQFRLYNISGQTLYVVNSEGTRTLRPREFYDLPLDKISHHIKLMVRRGFLNLFEKEET